jgi:hypothetical protein
MKVNIIKSNFSLSIFIFIAMTTLSWANPPINSLVGKQSKKIFSPPSYAQILSILDGAVSDLEKVQRMVGPSFENYCLSSADMAKLSPHHTSSLIDHQNRRNYLTIYFFDQFFSKTPQRYFPKWKGSRDVGFDKSYKSIFNFFNDENRMNESLRDLELEICIKKQLTPEKSKKLILQETLGNWEQQQSFKPVVSLPEKILPQEEWFSLVRSGSLFQDRYWRLADHGQETHRVQWNLVFREMKKRPRIFNNNVEGVQLYRELGNLEMIENYEWNENIPEDERNLWFFLFDTRFEQNFTSPVFTKAVVKKCFTGIDGIY